MTEGTCSCAERSHGGFVFTCPLCVKAVLVSAAYRALTDLGLDVTIDRSGSVSASVEGEELHG